MTVFYKVLLIGLVCVLLALLVFALSRKDIYDKLNAVFAMNTPIVLLILVIGLITDRFDMFIDIAISYAILGFVTTVILAKYIGGRKQ